MPSEFAEARNAAYRDEFQQNRENVPEELKSGKLNRKIKNFCDKHLFDQIDEVKAEILKSPFLAAWFAKDPKKQNFFEKFAAKFIQEIKGVQNFKHLPSNSTVVSNGAVMPKKTLKDTGGSSTAKTVDFQWKYGRFTVYASHKHTDVEGGSQGNQYNDLQAFIYEARKTTKTDTLFIAIADGDFYQRNSGTANMTRMDRLKQLAGGREVLACTTDTLEATLKARVPSAP